jgi:hypothetical protein
MKHRFSTHCTATLLGTLLVACGGSSPEAEPDPKPAVEAGEASDGEEAIHQDGFEAGDEREWSESVVAPDGEDDEPDVP